MSECVVRCKKLSKWIQRHEIFVIFCFRELYNAEKFEEYISVHSFIDEEYTQEKYTVSVSSRTTRVT